jgi:ABC-2 type transport system permease protein
VPTLVYVQVARRAHRRFATYRAATLTALVESTVGALLRTYVWLAVLAGRSDVRGFHRADLITFAFAAQAIHSVFQPTYETEIIERIRSGDIVTDLYRPVDFQLWWLAHEAGRVAYQLVTRGLPPVVIGALVFDLALPAGPAAWAAFSLSLVLAFVVVFAWKLLVSLTGFWLLHPLGIIQVAAGLYTFGSGSLIPLTFMPAALGHVLRWLPFASMVQLPIEILLGRAPLGRLAIQAGWAFTFLAIGRLVLARAQRRLVVHGG